MLNFKKISAVLTSAVMIGSSIGIAAAANYPAPFVSGGSADVAVVYGTGSGVSVLDAVQAGNIQSNLQSFLGTGSSTGGSVSTSGETSPLFTGSSKVYVNSSLNTVKTTFTKSELPTVLEDGSFSGDVSANYQQNIILGATPTLVYSKNPTSSDEPNYGPAFSTTASNYIYNTTTVFNKAVNFTSSSSKGQPIVLFGQSLTISPETTATKLVLLKSAEKISLDSASNPSQKVTVVGKDYTVELVTATTTTATVKVTDGAGNSDTRKLTAIDSGGISATIKGLTIAVNTADSNTPLNKISAEIIVGAEKLTLNDGGQVTVGDSNTAVSGSAVNITGATNAATQIKVSIAAPDSDHDGLKAGQSFVDPVWGGFKLDYAGLNEDLNSSSRESVNFKSSGDDKMSVQFTDYRGKTSGNVVYAKNQSDQLYLQNGDDGKNISIAEMGQVFRGEYVIVGNENTGHLLKFSSVSNSSDTGFSSDNVQFTDVISGESYTANAVSKGTATLTVEGKQHTVTYGGPAGNDGAWIRVNQQDSTGNNMVLFPTIQTMKGAKLSLYTPQTINLSNWDGSNNNVAGFLLPNGNGYTTVSVSSTNGTNWSIGSAIISPLALAANSTLVSAGSLVYNFTGAGNNATTVRLIQPAATNLGNINYPGVVLVEEKDNNNNYNGVIVATQAGATSTNGIGVSAFYRTWSNDSASGSQFGGGPTTFGAITSAANSNLVNEADLYGLVTTRDTSSSVHPSGMISYPDDQVYGQLYFSASSATVSGSSDSGGTQSTQLGEVLVKDSEVSSVSSKNLIIIGGSCINTAAATALGVDAGTCGSAFTTATGVGSGQFLIQSKAGAFTSGKIALVVAGYDAADTQNAAKYLTTQTVDTSDGKKYTGTSATTATLVTNSA